MLEQIKMMYRTGQEAREIDIGKEIVRENQGANSLEMRLYLIKIDPALVEDLDRKLNGQILEYQRQLDKLQKPANLVEKVAYNLGYIIAGHF